LQYINTNMDAVRSIASYSFLTTPSVPGASLRSIGQAARTISLGEESKITVKQILWGLTGVAAATTATDNKLERVKSSLPSIFENDQNSTSLRDWYRLFADVNIDEDLRQCLNLAVALTFLLQCGRKNINVTPPDLDFTWALVYGALTCPLIKFKVFRSALGYHSIPLWSHVTQAGNIDELFRLHVFVPDDHEKRTPISNVHTHQAFSQGWIITGLGTDYVYKIEPADEGTATHTEFNIAWNKDKSKAGEKGALSQQSASSTMTNTKNFVRAISGERRVHSRGTNYTVPAGKYHTLDVGSDELHATIFFFDARRGFQLESPALGPLDGSSLILPRAPPAATASQLAKTVHCLRQWEDLFAQGTYHVRNAEWEEGLRALRKAERLCVFLDDEPHSPLKYAPRYIWAVQGEIGHAYRMIGRNKDAIEILGPAISRMPANLQRIELLGELSVVHRHNNNLKASQDCTEDAYNTAKELLNSPLARDPGLKLKLKKEMCRAIGDWGMVNYQVFLNTRESKWLELAMKQLNERLDLARAIKGAPELLLLSEEEREGLIEYCSQREAIALARLSLCYTEIAAIEDAIDAAKDALDIQLQNQNDPTKIAFSRYFYGRALLRAGRKEEAMVEFNPPDTCTPAIALCKEASDEHRGYIRDLIESGADMELRDEQGYSALECAVYCDDQASQRLIEDGLRRKFVFEARNANPNPSVAQSIDLLDKVEKRLDQLRYEAYIRKGYRHIVQDTIRPVLLQAPHASVMDRLRTEYFDALKAVNESKILFDRLKVVYYSDFIAAGKIPRYGDGFTREIIPNSSGSSTSEFVIFFSYRWIGAWNPAEKSATPDDNDNTQYKHMVRALNDFVREHPRIDRQKLCIWLVSSWVTIY
jgi:tetratricopeptide (TPR) repeat protein